MGCQCCKEEEQQKERKQSELPDNWNPNRVNIATGKTQVHVVNQKAETLKADCIILAVSSKGLSPKISGQHIQALQECLEQNDGALEYGNCYSHNASEKKLLFITLPIWKGGERNELNILQAALTKLVKAIRESSLSSIIIDDVGVQYFGFPKQIIIKALIDTFAVFLQDETYVENITYASSDKATIHMIETILKEKHPHLFQEQKEERKTVKSNQNDITNDLEAPLLAE